MLSEEQLEVLEQQQYVQSLFQARQEAEALPRAVWLLLGVVAQQLESQRRQIEVQQSEIDELKRRLQDHPSTRTAAVPDAFQRWMVSHRAEVAEHRGRHIAVDAEKGILASAADYASLVEELERRGVPDDQVVIEFIPPAFSWK